MVGCGGQRKCSDLWELDSIQRILQRSGVLDAHGDDFEGAEIRQGCQASGEGLKYWPHLVASQVYSHTP